MTHVDIYRKLERFDLGSTKRMLAYTAIAVIALFVVVAVVPQRFVELIASENPPGFITLPAGEESRFLSVPTVLIGPLIVASLVIGILAAAESRSYIGAGVTRKAMWMDARRTNIGFAVILLVFVIIAYVIGLTLEGAWGHVDFGQSLINSGQYFLTLLALFEIGYFISMLYVRYHWLPASIVTLPYVLLLGVASLGLEFEGTTDWPWYRVLALIVVIAVTLPWPYFMAKTMPIRRSH